MSGASASMLAPFAAGVLILLVGAVSASTSPNALHRVAGVLAAICGSLLSLAALGMGQDVLLAGAAVALAQVIVGVALAVRLQEAYGGIEVDDIDAADAAAEPPERGE